MDLFSSPCRHGYSMNATSAPQDQAATHRGVPEGR